MERYIWEHQNWPNFTFDTSATERLLHRIHYLHGTLDAAAMTVDTAAREKIQIEMLADETLKSNEIEGVLLEAASVWSSVSLRLGIDNSVPKKLDKGSENAAALVMDAVQNHNTPLTCERLFGWHRLLFSDTAPKLQPPVVGGWRTKPVSIISGRYEGRQIEIFEGVPAEQVKREMARLLVSIQSKPQYHYLIESAVTHLWFVCIHPFGDGNGRIARALSDYLLARGDERKDHLYSISGQIHRDRNQYYEALTSVSASPSVDITSWVVWYLEMLQRSLEYSVEEIRKVLDLSRLVRSLDPNHYNARQISMLCKLVEGSFFGKLTTAKWAKMTKSTSYTAGRDINELVEIGLLIKSEAGGRSTSYELTTDLWNLLDGEDIPMETTNG
ncbi:MAG: Fic family protein [Bacteroidetes bacterium]|nr:Fic family protein [Bacteroidota bacterium]